MNDQRIEPASEKNDAEVREIWMTCFGDTRQYTEFLFGKLVKPENVFVYTVAGQAAAMLCTEPFTAKTPQGTANGAYVFGVATLPQWRKRGFSRSLLAETERQLAERGIAVTALVPAGEPLFDFYAKQGYETTFFVKKAVYAATEIAAEHIDCVLTPIGPETLSDFRREFYSGRRLFVDWSDDYMAYIDREARSLGGGTFSVSKNGRSGYVVCYPYKNSLIVKELAVPENMFGEISAALHACYGKAEYRFHLPEDFPIDVDIRPFAMTKWLDKNVQKLLQQQKKPSRPNIASYSDPCSDPYIAHVLDGPTLGVSLQDV